MKRSLPAPRPVHISDVHFIAAPPADVERGLLGWARATLNGVLRLDGIAVRQTLTGRMTISYPAKRDRAGREHKLMRPVNAAVGREIEHLVLAALGFREGSAP